MVFYISTIIGYLVVLLTLGVYLARRIKSKEDFLVAGRKLTAPILVGTLLATWIGSGDIFSVSDLSYHHGYSSLIGSAGGWLGIIAVFFIAGKVRRFGQFTVPDILEARYNKWARLLATITTIIAYITIVSYQFRGGGWVINMISDKEISMENAMIIMAIFVIVYTLTAGMLSVAYLDIINGIIIIGGVFLTIPFLIKSGGGIEAITANLPARAHPILGNMPLIEAMGYFIPTLLLALGNANMYQRFFSAKNEKEAKKSVIGWVVGVILLGIAIQSLAVIGSSISDFKGLPTEESGKIILLVAHKGVPVVIGCVLLAAIIAIVVSTANSFLLVPATNVMRDIVQRFIKPDISDKAMVLGTRVALVILGVLSYLLIGFFPRILRAAYAAYTIYGAGLTPALIATFFWKRATPKAGVISISAGMLVTIEWEIFNKIFGLYPWGIPAVYPALISSVLLLILVSYLCSPPAKEKWQPFFKEQ
ncbi:MAG: sodium:solute symporter family protein [Candidatus Aminicenantes bacterium]|nr:sodium:solute symporter family protein [Candidatus Aminicenantes bacterium]NIM84586.1 sodium:solute symporter family protein [Candidatus Aminicenantes bacterium]NIN24108.1 sodium:solute symporter family protein [Candidatus Aminicenantes bacterium]NIN47814.1 sodium:solute symporter family protein [Candidatus Aminicenantes bacterium]NIN90752.1 sodium:solute symporter family protein [Candidatus Aminicenantes bacterium]